MKVVQNFKERTPPTGLVSTTPYKIKVKTTPTFTPAKLPSYNIDAEEFLQGGGEVLHCCTKKKLNVYQQLIPMQSLCAVKKQHLLPDGG